MNGKSKKGRSKKGQGKKGAAARPQKGLLSRLFKGLDRDDGKPAKGGKKAAGTAPNGKAKARPLTPLERSIQEIKHMTKVGKSDPERLAMLLSRLLSQEKEKERMAQEEFDRMVWDIVKKEEKTDEDDAEA